MIRISRSIIDHWLWQDANRLKWWLDLIIMAEREERKVLHDTHLITLKRGQMIASVADLAKRWARSPRTILTYLQTLETEQMITRAVLHRQTPILTICNYDIYQCENESDLHTIVHSIVHRQNDENLSYAVHRQKSDLNISQSESLGYANENELHRQTEDNLHTMLHRQTKTKETFPPTPPYKEKKNNNFLGVEVKGARAHESFGASSFKAFQALSMDEKIDLLRQSPIWCEEMCYKHRMDENALSVKLAEFRSHCICEGAVHNNEQHLKSHFNRWLTYNNQSKPYDTTTTTNRGISPDREQRDREFAEFVMRNAPNNGS